MIDRRTVLTGLVIGLACPQVVLAASLRAAALIGAARRQVGVTLDYDPAYTAMAFPNGDVARRKGVCTDVIVRAYRDAFAVDLQSLVHADMKAAFAAYPKIWGLRRPDRNIDHRRVPNLQAFLARKGARATPPNDPGGWRPGDIFTAMIGGRLPHIGIVSDRRGRSGNPLIIHNIGAGAREEDALFAHKLTGRYRFMLGSS